MEAERVEVEEGSRQDKHACQFHVVGVGFQDPRHVHSLLPRRELRLAAGEFELRDDTPGDHAVQFDIPNRDIAHRCHSSLERLSLGGGHFIESAGKGHPQDETAGRRGRELLEAEVLVLGSHDMVAILGLFPELGGVLPQNSFRGGEFFGLFPALIVAHISELGPRGRIAVQNELTRVRVDAKLARAGLAPCLSEWRDPRFLDHFGGRRDDDIDQNAG